MKKVYFKTFGCRTNQFDTQVMLSNLHQFTISNEETQSDIVVINSCTVTNGADSSVRQYISSLKRKNPNAKIILAGCGAHAKGETLWKDGSVFGVMGHSEKSNINKLLQNEEPFYEIGDLNHIDTTVVENFIGKSRAFIKIQEGCNFDCSYCIIPQVRGRARSHAEDTILEQIKILASNGYGEFVLTGTNVGSYGRDIGSSLAALLKKISSIRGVRRIRIGSLEPIQIDDGFKELLTEPWMAKHLHIALQHTSDEMLSLMNRRNKFNEDIKLLNFLAEHGYALGTDYIVGHPGESEAIWKEAMQRVWSLPLTHIHAFTYSRRDNTASAFMKQDISGDIAKIRHNELTSCIKAKNREFREKNYKNLEVLLESGQNNIYKGFDQYYNTLEVFSQEDLSGNWILAESVEVQDEKNRLQF
ncbi:MAG: tRNA (N(6)-L-threonylcarbamoyladenosine(37)-C(2))-methylthiotransferase MtaB [Sulfurovaceae bacterium]|nr:tRNA (N(6)-L-threonylcarbamoyladenosine(37)-C(2))-methylthiotransferase MtaB [Sulfurovaceae bacterium]